MERKWRLAQKSDHRQEMYNELVVGWNCFKHGKISAEQTEGGKEMRIGIIHQTNGRRKNPGDWDRRAADGRASTMLLGTGDKIRAIEMLG
jgi:hypothetical protein